MHRIYKQTFFHNFAYVHIVASLMQNDEKLLLK